MKKGLIISLSVFMLIALAVQAKDKFIESFRNCTPYSSSGTVDANGITAVSHKQISGWQNGKCSYTETTNMQEIKAKITCNFNKSQLNELYKVMDAYDTLYGNSRNINTENNPVLNTWNKYLNNSSVCNMSIN